MKLTAEQESIIQSGARVLKVNAFAGSSKTTTLNLYSRARTSKWMLYLAFSKAVRVHANGIFPSNVKCATAHALAFPGFGANYKNANKLVSGLRIGEIVNHIDLRNIPDEMHFYAADLCIRTISRFLTTTDQEISLNSVGDIIMPNNYIGADYVRDMSRILWKKMQNVNDSSIGMPHDGYLKLYFLSDPKLNYDCLLFDEAQDANPVMAEIINRQNDSSKVIVGDEHQAIFGFRHAVNAMADFQADETLSLSKSFRFGSEIASVGNFLLSKYKGETRNLVGNDNVRSRIGFISPKASFAIVARANATLFSEAAAALSANKKIHHVGGVEGYRLSDMVDAYHLMAGHHSDIKNPQIRAFKNFEAFEEYAEVSGDKEFRGVAGVAKRHGASVPKLVHAVKSLSQKDAASASVILATTHKAKGLEFDNVKLADDFIPLLDNADKPIEIKSNRHEDINMIYVAATRARNVLQPFPDLLKLLSTEKQKESTSSVPSWAAAINNQ